MSKINTQMMNDKELIERIQQLNLLEDNFLIKCFEEYKKDKDGICIMSGVLEEMITDDRKNIAIRMLKDGEVTNEKIAIFLDLPLEKIEEWAEEL